jgi:hypothetical protein
MLAIRDRDSNSRYVKLILTADFYQNCFLFLQHTQQMNMKLDDCLLPLEIGNKCTHQVWRWYYDSNAGECYQFSYSGCLGNNNNFATSQTCIWLCASVGKDLSL